MFSTIKILVCIKREGKGETVIFDEWTCSSSINNCLIFNPFAACTSFSYYYQYAPNHQIFFNFQFFFSFSSKIKKFKNAKDVRETLRGDVFNLRRGTGKSVDEDMSFHFMSSLRLEYVQVVGTVVKVKEKAKHDVVGIADGTGVIEVLRWHTDSKGREANIGALPRLGDSVRVCGKLKYPGGPVHQSQRDQRGLFDGASRSNFELLFGCRQ